MKCLNKKKWHLSLLVLVFILFITTKSQSEDSKSDTENLIDTLIEQSLASSNQTISFEFKTHATIFFKKIKLLGIDTLQSKSIDSIIDYIQNEVKVKINTEVRYKNNDAFETSRNCAQWDKKTNTIYISHSNWIRLKNDEKEWIAGHEISGILGIDDNKFQITSLLAAYETISKIQSQPAAQKKINPNSLDTFKKTIKKNSSLIENNSGGVSGVGGGGDTRPLAYKTQLLIQAFLSLNFQEFNSEVFAEIINQYQTINIEFSDNIEQGSFLFNPDSMTIYVPNNPFTVRNYLINQVTIMLIHQNIVEKITDGSK